MTEVSFDFSKKGGVIKPLHAVNNGPIKDTPMRQNIKAFKAAGIPYARLHDSAFHYDYGGEHSVDVNLLFPDFSKDENDPASYDFALTDVYLNNILEGGTEVFYRLGSKIESSIKKYGTLMPADFAKWARICEHIILHYNEGWADGYHMGITYWEIWNEPDLVDDSMKPEEKATWGGTKKEFFEFYKTVSTYLKSRFPSLKIGGPALAYKVGDWLDDFLGFVKETNSPLDFFSWHIYSILPHKVADRANLIREKLDRFGFEKTESILNEWNYVENFDSLYVRSFDVIASMRGAAYTAACMCIAQEAPIDMLMYYDARPCAFNGMFDPYALRPLRGYYPFKMFNEVYKRKNEVKCICRDDGRAFNEPTEGDTSSRPSAKVDTNSVYAVAAKDDDGSFAAMICYYTDDRDAGVKEIKLDIDFDYDCFILDEHCTCSDAIDLDRETNTIVLYPSSVLLIKSK